MYRACSTRRSTPIIPEASKGRKRGKAGARGRSDAVRARRAGRTRLAQHRSSGGASRARVCRAGLRGDGGSRGDPGPRPAAHPGRAVEWAVSPARRGSVAPRPRAGPSVWRIGWRAGRARLRRLIRRVDPVSARGPGRHRLGQPHGDEITQEYGRLHAPARQRSGARGRTDRGCRLVLRGPRGPDTGRAAGHEPLGAGPGARGTAARAFPAPALSDAQLRRGPRRCRDGGVRPDARGQPPTRRRASISAQASRRQRPAGSEARRVGGQAPEQGAARSAQQLPHRRAAHPGALTGLPGRPAGVEATPCGAPRHQEQPRELLPVAG